MASEQPHEASIFNAARNLSSREAQAQYLAEACGDDTALRDRVEKLLAAFDAESQFLEQPAPELTETIGHERSPSQESDVSEAILAGKYKLIEPIGEGGMGAVWRAQQFAPVKREVAVKLIKPGMDSKTVLARFEAERQALALMDHPSIAKVLDAGMTADQRPFFVMELVRGIPITEFCDRRKLSPKQRLELFVPVCQAIQHAHQKGIIHRDIKPSNVLVALYDDQAIPKVIDFGVAKATGMSLTEQTIHTVFDGVVGTPQYMSPEQATFNNLDIDTRTDVYSLGALLYELLAGSPPFSQQELAQQGVLEILRVVREEEPQKPSTKLRSSATVEALSVSRGMESSRLTSLLRSELDWVVLKALEKDRTRRYETANAFATDIQRYLTGEAVLAHPPGAWYRASKVLRRHRRAVISISLIAIALIVGVIGTGYGYLEADAARKNESSQRKIAESERSKAVERATQLAAANETITKERERTERSLATSQILLAEAAWKGTGTAAQAKANLDSVPEQYRGWEHGFLKRKYQGGYATLYGHTADVTCLDFSPDGDRIASGSYDQTIRVWDADTGICLQTLKKHTGIVTNVAFSPDGSRLLSVSSNNEVCLWETDDYQCLLKTDGQIGGDKSPPISHDGSRIAISNDGSKFTLINSKNVVELREVSTGALLNEISGLEDRINNLEFNSDDSTLIVLLSRRDPNFESWIDIDIIGEREFEPDYGPPGYNTTVRVYRISDCTQIASREFSYACYVAASPTDNQVAISFTDGSLQVWSDDLSQKSIGFDVGSTQHFAPTSCEYSPDGKRLVISMEQGPSRMIDLAAGQVVKTQDSLSYWRGIQSRENAWFSPDGMRLLLANSNGAISVSDTNTGEMIELRKGHHSAAHSLSFAPDSRRFASAGFGENTIRVWALDTTNDSLTLDEPLVKNDLTMLDARFVLSPDGTKLVVANDGQVSVVDVKTGTISKTLQGMMDHNFKRIAFSPDGSQVASAESPDDDENDVNDSAQPVGCGVKLWDLNSDECRKLTNEPAISVEFDSSGKKMVTVRSDGVAEIWDCNLGERTGELKLSDARIVTVKFLQEGQGFAATFELDSGDRLEGGIALWKSESDTNPRLFNASRYANAAVGVGVQDLVTGGDFMRYCAWFQDDSIRVFTLDNGIPTTEPVVIQGHFANVLAISADGRRIASGAGPSDRTVRIWDAETGTSLLVIDDFDEATFEIEELAFSDDGRMLLVAADRWMVRQGLTQSTKNGVIAAPHKPVVAFEVAALDGGIDSVADANEIHYRQRTARPSAAFHRHLAMQAESANNKFAAEFHWERLEEIRPGAKASVLAEQGDIDGAIAAYRKQIEAEPNQILAHNMLGVLLYNHKQDYHGALTCFRRVVEIAPHNADAYANLARSLSNLGDVDGAISSYRKAVEIDPGNDGVYISLGAILCDIKRDFDGAIACFLKAIELDPNNSTPYFNIGVALKGKGDLQGAIANYRRGLKLMPNDTTLHNSLGDALWKVSDWDGAVASYQKALELDPSDADTHSNLGDVYLDAGKIAQGVSSYQKALDLNPDDASSHNSAAWKLANRTDSVGRFPQAEQAVAWARSATELEPDESGYQNTLGVTLLRSGQWQGACEALLKSIELGNDGLYNWLFLAMANWQLNQKDKAQEWYEKSLAWKMANEEELQEDAELQGFFAEAAELMATDENSEIILTSPAESSR